MKSFGGGHLNDTELGISAEDALRYSMSLPVATVVSGMDSLEVLRKNIAVADGFTPLSTEEREALLSRSAPYADGGKGELFKSTRNFEGKVGRIANNYPVNS
jgi:hypothetical protein